VLARSASDAASSSRFALRFSRALDGLHALLVTVTEHTQPAAPGQGALPRGPRARRLLAEIRQELRYLQRAFDGGSLLLASALETFGGKSG
jgi:hypothetical protein